MKPISYLILLFISVSLSGQPGPVNAILGDTSWVSAYGSQPGVNENEVQRIATHLDLVISRLKLSQAADHSLQPTRDKLIRLLEDYREAQIFPTDFEFSETRRPCFIDNSGNICAVGYLVEKTAGREAAEVLNSSFQYSYLLDMESKLLNNWQEQSGFSMKELAMIQPSYGMPIGRRLYMNEKKKFGTRDRYSDKILIKAKYDEIRLGAHANLQDYPGMEIVKLNGLWGLVDGKGKKITKIEYDSIFGSYGKSSAAHTISMNRGEDKSSSYVFAYKNGVLSLFNKYGVTIAKYKGSDVTHFNDPYFVVKTASKIGVLDTDNNWVVKPQYISIVPYTDGTRCSGPNIRVRRSYEVESFIVRDKNGLGLVGLNSEVIIPPKYKYLYKSRPRTWLATDYKAQNYLFNEKGQESGLKNLRNVQVFGRCYENYFVAMQEDRFGLIDSNFNWVLQPKYDRISDNGNLIKVETGDSMGYYQRNGEVFLEPIYEHVYKRKDGKIAVRIDGKSGLLNEKREVVIPIEFPKLMVVARDYTDGKDCYAAFDGQDWQLFNLKGELISSQKFDSLKSMGTSTFIAGLDGLLYLGQYKNGGVQFNHQEPFQSLEVVGPRILSYQRNGKYGFWHLQANISSDKSRLSEPKFDEIVNMRFKDNQRYVVKYKGKYGISSHKGELIVEAKFSRYVDTHQGYGLLHYTHFRDEIGWYTYNIKDDKLEKLREEQNKRLDKKYPEN